MLTLFAGRTSPSSASRSSTRKRYGELFRGLLERGVYVAPSQYECLFPSLAHGDDGDRRDDRGGRRRPRCACMTTIAVRRPAGEPALGAVASADGAELGAGLLPARAGASSRSASRRCTRRTSTHYGRPRLFDAGDADEAILLGDYLYAHGLVRVAEAGGVRRSP